MRYELFTVFQSDDSIDVFVANEVVGVSRDGGENDKNWDQSLLVSLTVSGSEVVPVLPPSLCFS